jgi:hypothetical protein
MIAGVLGVLLVAAGEPARAVDAPPVNPTVDLATWEAQLRSRVAASRVPGWVYSPSGVTTSSAGRLAGAKRSIALSKAPTAVEAGKVLVPGETAGTAAKFGMVLKGAGDVAQTVVGVDLVYSAFTGQLADGFGFQGLTGVKSDGLLCDIQTLFGGGCEFAPAQSYVADGDVVVPLVPGWTSGNQVVSCWYGAYGTRACVKTAGIVYAISGQAAYAGVTQVTVTGTVLASPVSTQNSIGSWVGVFCRGGSSSVGDLGMGGTLLTWHRTVTCTTGLDRVEIDGQDALSGDWSGSTTPTVPRDSTWYPVGHPSRPIDPILNPQRWWVTTWKCDGGSPHTITSTPWHETDVEWPTPPMPSCDAGSVSEVTVRQTGEGVPDQTLYTWAADPTQTTWAATYPQCTNGSCTLELSRVDASTGTRLACFDNPELCVDWFADPAKTTDYVCTYAGTDLALSECNMYSQVFDQTKRQAGGTIADPQTGEIPAGLVVPPVPAEDASCPPAFSWSALFNPWYYYKGVTCALSWAFVPSAASATAWQGFISTTSTHPPVNVMISGSTLITGVVSEVGQPGDCSGAPLEMANTDLIHTSYNLCTAASDLASHNPGRYLYLLMEVGIVVGAVWIGFHRIRASFGGK